MLSQNARISLRRLDGGASLAINRISVANISSLKPKAKVVKTTETSSETPPEMVMTDEYQFMKKSMLSSYYFQDSLPRLPIPSMEDTMKRYLESLEPIVSSEQLAATKKLTEEFQNGIGKSKFVICI